MQLATVDFETYYDKLYSLTKMSTEDYVTDPRFEVILVCVKLGHGPVQRFSGKMAEVKEWLHSLELNRYAWLSHNTMFDALIAAVHFDIHPPFYFDTLQMAQAMLKPYTRSISLANCLKYLVNHINHSKGTYVHDMMGRRRESLRPDELAQYMQYCADDVTGTYLLFEYLKRQMPRDEFEIMDIVTRMYLNPQFELDAPLLEATYERAIEKKEALLSELPEGVHLAQLMSNQQFAEVLKGYDVPIPMKVSPATGQLTPAFAKNDPGWKDLVETYDEDPVIAPILAARTGVKSTLTETRALKLLTIANRYPKFRVPLRYYAAHPGRLGGMEKLNAQNFTRIDDKLRRTDLPKIQNSKGELEHPLDRRQLRFAIKAPEGHSIVAADLKQIEARINAWLSGCHVLLEAFRRGADIYSEFASIIHNRLITSADKLERFIGKTCILGLGYGMGAPKLQATLRKDNLKYELNIVEYWVGMYRSTYREIPHLWTTCNRAIEIMASGGTMRIGPCVATYQKILLPNGMSLSYPNLRYRSQPDYEGYVYDFAGETRTLWGGKVVENIVQALARIIIWQHALDIKKYLKLTLALQAHDELVYVVPTRYAPKYAEAMAKLMRRQDNISWGRGIPIDVETGYGPTYGDCK